MKASVSAIALAAGFVTIAASAHTIVKDPAPIGNNAQLLTSPCGCSFVQGASDACPTTYPVTTLVAGSQLPVTFTELQNHAGKFRIAISTLAPDAVTEADFDSHVLYMGVDNNTTANKDLTQTILVPDTPCDKCTLQVRQAASDGANPFYWSCAAIKIVPSAGTTGASTAAAAGTSSTSAGGGATAGSGGASSGGNGQPRWQPEPLPSGCSLSSGASEESSFGWLLPAAAALLIGARRKRQ